MGTQTKGAAAIRSDALRLHAEIRDALHRVAALASCAQHGDASCLSDLRVALQNLARSVRLHDVEERQLLDPFLRQVDAWGPERVQRLVQERSTELRLTTANAEEPDAQALIRTACGLIRPLARLLHQEEREALPPDVLRDDAIAIGQEDG